MHRDRTMIVAVVSVAKVQPAIAQIIYMIPVRNLRVPFHLVIAGAGHGRAGDRIDSTHGEHVFIVVVAMQKMQMSIVQVIDVISMLKGQVPALLTVDMCMAGVSCMLLHRGSSSQS
jgi:hypothetical protein